MSACMFFTCFLTVCDLRGTPLLGSRLRIGAIRRRSIGSKIFPDSNNPHKQGALSMFRPTVQRLRLPNMSRSGGSNLLSCVP